MLLAGCGQRGNLGTNRGEPTVDQSGSAENPSPDTSSEAPVDSQGPGDDDQPGQPFDPCDVDGDGFYDLACGGDDCDDEAASIHPGASDICNFVDENCDGVLNDEVNCQVYTHTSSQLFLVDPFLATEELVGTVPFILDFDTDIEGNLYGITSSFLYQFNDDSELWDTIGTFGGMDGSTNGFAINSLGQGFATSGNSLYKVELETGSAQLIGQFGENFNSSGDCVVNKSDRLFFSSNHDSQSDYLVVVNTSTGEGTSVGRIGFKNVYGLTAAWGSMFGFTGSGDVIRINETTGEGELIHTFAGRSWWGAASSPNR
jgi:hypothetical protein